MKRFLFIILASLSLASCTPSWVRELEAKNPLKDSADVVSVYFRFDTIINDYEVSGILYPYYDEKYGWSAYENGVRLFFHNLNSGKEYVWTDWDEGCQSFRWMFMSRNVRDIVWDNDFSGFKNGDFYIFHYHNLPDTFDTLAPENLVISNLYSNAEYQFLDIDFDGIDELIIGYFHGGPYGCTCYDIYELTDSALVEKRPVNSKNEYFSLNDHTCFDTAHKRLINKFYSGCCECGAYVYDAEDNGDLYFIYNVRESYDNVNDSFLSDTTYYKL